MGTGGRAAVDAAMASGLFSKLVKSGLGFDTALRIVNSALLAKSEEESFATLDLACFDFYTGACLSLIHIWGKEHLTFVPLTKDNRLCAKEIIGNRANLTKWQDDFHAYMVEKYPDLERGESASKTGRKHIPTRLFKQAVNLSKQARAMEATLDGITPLNAEKKKEEALAMLKK